MRKVYMAENNKKNKKADKNDLDIVDTLMGFICIVFLFIILSVYWVISSSNKKQITIDVISQAAPVAVQKKQWQAPMRIDDNNFNKPITYIEAIVKDNQVVISDIPKIKVSKKEPLKVSVIDDAPGKPINSKYVDSLKLIDYSLNNIIKTEISDNKDIATSIDGLSFVHDRDTDRYYLWVGDHYWQADETYIARNWGITFEINGRTFYNYGKKFYEQVGKNITPINQNEIPQKKGLK